MGGKKKGRGMRGREEREKERKGRAERKKEKKKKIIVLSFDDQNELSQKVLPVSLMCCSL